MHNSCLMGLNHDCLWSVQHSIWSISRFNLRQPSLHSTTPSTSESSTDLWIIPPSFTSELLIYITNNKSQHESLQYTTGHGLAWKHSYFTTLPLETKPVLDPISQLTLNMCCNLDYHVALSNVLSANTYCLVFIDLLRYLLKIVKLNWWEDFPLTNPCGPSLISSCLSKCTYSTICAFYTILSYHCTRLSSVQLSVLSLLFFSNKGTILAIHLNTRNWGCMLSHLQNALQLFTKTKQ